MKIIPSSQKPAPIIPAAAESASQPKPITAPNAVPAPPTLLAASASPRGLWAARPTRAEPQVRFENLGSMEFVEARRHFIRLYSEVVMSDIEPEGIGALFLLPYNKARDEFELLTLRFHTGKHNDSESAAPFATDSVLAKLFLLPPPQALQAFEEIYVQVLHRALPYPEPGIAWSELSQGRWRTRRDRLLTSKQKPLPDPIPELRRAPQHPPWFENFKGLSFPEALDRFRALWHGSRNARPVSALEYVPQCSFRDLSELPQLADLNPAGLGKLFLFSDRAAVELFERTYFLFHLHDPKNTYKARTAVDLGLSKQDQISIQKRLAIQDEHLYSFYLQNGTSDLTWLFSLPHHAALVEFRRLYFRVLLQAFDNDTRKLAAFTGMPVAKITLTLHRLGITHEAQEPKFIPRLRKNPPTETEVGTLDFASTVDLRRLEYEFADLFALDPKTAAEEFRRLYCRSLLAPIDFSGLGEVFFHDFEAASRLFQRFYQIAKLPQPLDDAKRIQASKTLRIPQQEIIATQRIIQSLRSDSALGQALSLSYNDAFDEFRDFYLKVLWKQFRGQASALIFWTGLNRTFLSEQAKRLGLKFGESGEGAPIEDLSGKSEPQRWRAWLALDFETAQAKFNALYQKWS